MCIILQTVSNKILARCIHTLDKDNTYSKYIFNKIKIKTNIMSYIIR